MAQVTFQGKAAVVTFDDPDMVVVARQRTVNPQFLQDAINELIVVHGRQHEQIDFDLNVSELKRTKFTRLRKDKGLA